MDIPSPSPFVLVRQRGASPLHLPPSQAVFVSRREALTTGEGNDGKGRRCALFTGPCGVAAST